MFDEISLFQTKWIRNHQQDLETGILRRFSSQATLFEFEALLQQFLPPPIGLCSRFLSSLPLPFFLIEISSRLLTCPLPRLESTDMPRFIWLLPTFSPPRSTKISLLPPTTWTSQTLDVTNTNWSTLVSDVLVMEVFRSRATWRQTDLETIALGDAGRKGKATIEADSSRAWIS